MGIFSQSVLKTFKNTFKINSIKDLEKKTKKFHSSTEIFATLLQIVNVKQSIKNLIK